MPGLISTASIQFEGAPLSRMRAEEIRMMTSKEGEIATIIKDKLRHCCLGILGASDSMNQMIDLNERYPDFDINLTKERLSVRLDIENAPSNAFIDGAVTSLRKGHLAAAIRDLAYQARHFGNAKTSESRSELVERMVGDAGLLAPQVVKMHGKLRNLYQVVFQGGHHIGTTDYGYAKRTGEEFGLRGWEGISGSGPGTMRGTLRGNLKGFRQQKVDGRQMGFTAPEIIIPEPPNVYVTDLVILPDIEKRLEAFTRKMHGIVFLPGGIGTTEELLIQIGVKMDKRNADQILPVVLTGYNEALPHVMNEFIGTVLGEQALEQYQTIINAPDAVATYITGQAPDIDLARGINDDAHEWNRSLIIPEDFQVPFHPSHETMETLQLDYDQPMGKLAAELRKLCKGIVYGNVIKQGIKEIEEKGKYKIHGDPKIIGALERFLLRLVVEKRMTAGHYEPCYELDNSVSVPGSNIPKKKIKS